ncbi:MAG: sodium/proton-translocating pyrophosphatase, partial [Syntrophomonas sp.]|nr:sodium/proton-translocating pyrophosphatase [Syntrophomonas sp.]
MKLQLKQALRPLLGFIAALAIVLLNPSLAAAGEANLVIPELSAGQNSLLYMGIIVCILGMFFGYYQFTRVAKLTAHQSMLDVAQTIYETCKTYLIQQGKFIAILFVFIGACVAFYYGYLSQMHLGSVLFILMWTVIGILGSYSVAWYGIRMNTLANSRVAFNSLERKPLKMLNIALDAGMSIGVLLVCVELIMMLIILLFVPRELAGASFIGFAIGESLGASALRIAGGIFTKIADIGADLMKIVFGIKEDDPRNPGVIADCTGDNAGDSVGPTADGFETYGVTGVAMVTFIVLAVAPALQTTLLTWIFAIRVLMVISSIASFYINRVVSQSRFGGLSDFDFEAPLTSLVWITSIVSIAVTFVLTYYLIVPGSSVATALTPLWTTLAIIMSFGTLSAALIPEAVKVFT